MTKRQRKFLTIIKNHSERLSSIIEDLLSLSRIEQDEGYGMELDPTDIASYRESKDVRSQPQKKIFALI